MSQSNSAFEARPREAGGKGAARKLRREGFVPAIIYGAGQPPLSIALPFKELSMRINAGGFTTAIAELKVGGETHRALPKEYQLDPVRDDVIHVDFLRVVKGSKVVVEIPVHFENEADSPGLKRGGVLNVVRHEIEVECPAESIPERITIDLTGWEIGDSIHISNVTLPEEVKPTITDRDFTIATIAGSSAMKADEDEEEAVEGEGEAEAEAEGAEEEKADGQE